MTDEDLSFNADAYEVGTIKYSLDIDKQVEHVLDHYGQVSQRIKAIEELSECITQLAKDLRDSMNVLQARRETVDELADAMIMLRQMRLLYGHAEVDAAIDEKLARTFERMRQLPY